MIVYHMNAIYMNLYIHMKCILTDNILLHNNCKCKCALKIFSRNLTGKSAKKLKMPLMKFGKQ